MTTFEGHKEKKGEISLNMENHHSCTDIRNKPQLGPDMKISTHSCCNPQPKTYFDPYKSIMQQVTL